ncbi:MAG: glycogen synthase GlgA [Clostridia bacterium]|nr:glycogen synthase GlgA [Clostridia bacterium]
MSSPKVLIAAAEGAPFAKTGGLADVVGALPAALKREGVEAAVIMPEHSVIKHNFRNRLTTVAAMQIQVGWRSQYLGIEKAEENGVTYYFIDNEYYFGGPIYKGGTAEDEQYMFFCRAVLEALPHIDFKPDIIHCNDWHTAMIPMLIRTQYQGRDQGGIKTVFTIHNLQYQGQMGFEALQDMLGISPQYFTPEYIEAYGCANMMKAGLVFCDRITTVSPTYAREILDPFYGRGMQGILNARSHETTGIVNGIETKDYDPATDRQIWVNYSVDDIPKKYENKSRLIQEMNMNISGSTPIISMVTRMTEQKGLDLVRAVLEELLHEDVAFCILGTGDREYQDYFNYIAAKYPGNSGIYIGYNDQLARRIYAGSDFILMPSLFEPCGLSQMLAQAYGALPIVRETGGLADTVQPYNIYTGEGNGFSFANYNAHDMLHIIRFALSVYRDKTSLLKLIKNAMLTDNSFEKSAKQYIEVYKSLVG